MLDHSEDVFDDMYLPVFSSQCNTDTRECNNNNNKKKPGINYQVILAISIYMFIFCIGDNQLQGFVRRLTKMLVPALKAYEPSNVHAKSYPHQHTMWEGEGQVDYTTPLGFCCIYIFWRNFVFSG